MFPPDEILIKDFLPILRALLSHELKRNGMSQIKIANLLGVTQAAVSLYLSKDETYYYKKLQNMGISMEEVRELVKLLSSDVSEDIVRANRALLGFWRSILAKGYLCEYHKKMHPQLMDCDACMTITEPVIWEHLNVLNDITNAILYIESSSYFADMIPKVAVNIAVALKDAKSLHDVAAIPGRIVSLKGRPKAMSKPEFGASKHLASVILRVMKEFSDIRAVMNIRYGKDVEEAVRKLALRFAYTEREETSDEAIIESIGKAFQRYGVLDVVFDRGGYGFEPITYVFGKSAIEVTRKALEIAKACRS